MAGVGNIRIVHAILSLIALALLATGTATASLYAIELEGQERLSIGVFRTCRGDDMCNETKWTSIDSCSVKEDDAEQRWDAIQVLLVASMAMSLVSLVTACCDTQRFAVLRIVTSLLSSLTVGIGAGLAVYFVEYWYFCESSPCSYYKSQGVTSSCDDGLSYGSWLLFAAGLAGFASLVVAAVAHSRMKNEKEIATEVAADPSEPVTSTVESTRQTSDQQQAAPVNVAVSDTQTRATADAPNEQQPHTAVAAKEEQSTAGAPAQSSSSAAEPQPSAAARSEEKERSQSQEAVELPAYMSSPQNTEKPSGVIPEGDWVYDPDSGMFWSEDAYLFLHTESGMFFDPNSEMWYDPAADMWMDDPNNPEETGVVMSPTPPAAAESPVGTPAAKSLL